MHPPGENHNSPSPSFNTYFDADLAQIVDRVTTEFVAAADDDSINFKERISTEQEDEDAADFEFNLTNLVPADSVYPVFDRNLLRGYDLVGQLESGSSDHEDKSTSAQIRLHNLFLEDRDGYLPSSSASEEEEDDPEEIPPGTYCVWTPNKSPSPSRCTKSNSTGSSATEKVKAWKLRDLLKRSKSDDGKDQSRMILLTPKKKIDTPAERGSVGTASTAASGERAGRGTAARDDNKRRSYLPYRQNLVGFTVSPRALSKLQILHF